MTLRIPGLRCGVCGSEELLIVSPGSDGARCDMFDLTLPTRDQGWCSIECARSAGLWPWANAIPGGDIPTVRGGAPREPSSLPGAARSFITRQHGQTPSPAAQAVFQGQGRLPPIGG